MRASSSSTAGPWKADEQLRDACADAWWVGRTLESAWVFSLSIEAATYIGWDTERGEMTIRRWSPEQGVQETRRTYP